MTLPGQKITVRDPGLGSSEPATMRPFICGPASKGDTAIHLFSDPGALRDFYEEGDLPEIGAYVLQAGGGPIAALKRGASVASANGSVTKAAVGTSTGTITVAGTSLLSPHVTVEITKTGALGSGAFRYTLDRSTLRTDSSQWTWSPEITIPSGGTYALQRTGLTLTFVPGAGTSFEDGDLHTFDPTAAKVNTTDLDTAFTTIKASKIPWRFFVLANQSASGAAAATLFGALAVHMTSLENMFRYRRAMMSAGADTAANVATAFASQWSNRILVAHGMMDVASSKPFVGWGNPSLPVLEAFARNATGPNSLGWGLPSTDLKRVLGGSIPGIQTKPDGSPAISYNEDSSDSIDLDSQGISTLRTHPERGGAFVTQGRLKAQPGSDFWAWQLGIMMDIACEIVVSSQSVWIGEDMSTNDDGSIDDDDAQRIETQIEQKLAAQFVGKPRANGKRGYVQDVQYKIDRTVDVMTSGYIQSTVAMKPHKSIEGFNTSLGYARQIVRIPVNA
jgi:hypothetical protein